MAVALLVPTAAVLSACNPTPLRDDEAEPASEAAATTTTPAEAASPGTAAPPTTEAPPPAAAAAPAPQAVSAPTPEGAPVVPGEQFFASFDTPEDFFDRFQREVFFGGDGNDRSSLAQWQGDHSMGCEGPMTQRTVHSDGAHNDEMFWWCAPKGPESGHIMTSMYTEGYAQVLFAPNESFTDVTEVCWDQNMTTLPRKWTQVVMVPEDLYESNGGKLHYVNPALLPFPADGGLPPGPMSQGPDGDQMPALYDEWNAYVLTFTSGSVDQHSREGNDTYFNAPPTDDKATRFRQCATDNGDGTVTHVNQLADGTTRTITLRGSFPDGEVRVIFQDDTYDSFKTDLGDRSGGDDPRATWHWDNISIT